MLRLMGADAASGVASALDEAFHLALAKPWLSPLAWLWAAVV